MPLEDGDYICDLVPTNPPNSDLVSEGNEHIQLLKKVLLQSFPNICGEVELSHDDINNLASSQRPIVTEYKEALGPQVHTFTPGRSWYRAVL